MEDTLISLYESDVRLARKEVVRLAQANDALQARVNELEQENKALKDRVTVLENHIKNLEQEAQPHDISSDG